MAVLYLIRHGEPEIQGVFLGRLDPPLSAVGYEHVSRVMSDIEVKVAYSSPLRRARETARYLRSPRILEVNNLREIDYGKWTGKTWAEVEADWSELAARKCTDWLGVSAPEGESWSDVLDRIRPVWETICRGETPAAVVAHQGVNAALATLIDGRNPLEFNQQYGEVIRVEYD